MTPQIREPITHPFARIDGLPVAVGIVNDTLSMVAAFAEAFPGIRLVVYSGIRTYEDQVRIFKLRYVTADQIRGRRVYDVRRWQGVLWYRISSVGTVAAPGSSNHETGRSLDLRDTGSDAGVAASFTNARNRWLSANCWRWGFTHTGRNFAEPWHFEQLQVSDPWGGLGKPLNIVTSDPGQPLTTSAGGSSSGSGGSAAAPIIQSEEDDMALFRITNGKWKGRHYALDTEYIKMISSKESVMSSEELRGRTEIAATEAEFRIELGIAGVPSTVLDHRGYVLNDLEGGTEYVSGGSWSRAQKNERVLYVLQKNQKKG